MRYGRQLLPLLTAVEMLYSNPSYSASLTIHQFSVRRQVTPPTLDSYNNSLVWQIMQMSQYGTREGKIRWWIILIFL